MLVLSITENMGFGFVDSGVAFGDESGVASGVCFRSGVGSGVDVAIDAVGVAVGNRLTLFPFPPARIHAIKTPVTPITATIARIQGNGLCRFTSTDSAAVWRPGKRNCSGRPVIVDCAGAAGD
jgi:hypothetical protein